MNDRPSPDELPVALDMVRNREVQKSRMVLISTMIAAKLNGHTVERITRRTLTSPHLRRVQPLRRLLVYGLLMIAKLAGPLIGVKNTSELGSPRYI